MKGEGYVKLIVILLCVVVASYFVFSVVRVPDTGFSTYKAVLYEVGDGISTSGFVVRDEEVLQADQDIVVLTRSEGERVGKGMSVASTFLDAEAQARQNRIDQLEEELGQMEYAYSFSASDVESATLDSDIIRAMNQVSIYVNHRDFTFADGAAEQLKAFVLRRYITSADAKTLWSRITAARNQLNELYTQAKSESGAVTVDKAGYFSGVVDGYETVLTHDFISDARVAEIENVQPLSVGNTALGKLVTSPKWYYVAVVDAESLEGLSSGRRVSVSFSYDFYENVPMRIERIGAEEDGKCVLVLATDELIQNAVSSRSQSADIIFDDKSGLRVPKTAIYVNEEGQSGVYVLEGAEASWKTVDIIYDNGESYIVKLDKSSTKNLWPEDEIILTKEPIFNGKVMVK